MFAELEKTTLQTDLEKAVVTGLFYYPIKSCKGWPLEEAELTERGILHDREFMIVDAATGVVVTQREIPKMALLAPHVIGNSLRLEAPGMPTLEIPILQSGPTSLAIVWGDECQSVDQGDAVAEWISEYLSTPVRLVRMDDAFMRKVDNKYAIHEDDQVGFADGYPCLIISEESLADLNSRMESALLMNRFRPNIVISGSGVAFGEDLLKEFQLGEITFYGVKPCGRCVLTTTDQATAERGKEPLRTLSKYRKALNNNVLFGQNLLHNKPGTLKIGSSVKVVELQSPPELKENSNEE